MAGGGAGSSCRPGGAGPAAHRGRGPQRPPQLEERPSAARPAAPAPAEPHGEPAHHGGRLPGQGEGRAKSRTRYGLDVGPVLEGVCLGSPGTGSMSVHSLNETTCLRSRPLGFVGTLCRERVLGRSVPYTDIDSAKKASLGPLACPPHEVCCCSCWSWPRG